MVVSLACIPSCNIFNRVEDLRLTYRKNASKIRRGRKQEDVSCGVTYGQPLHTYTIQEKRNDRGRCYRIFHFSFSISIFDLIEKMLFAGD